MKQILTYENFIERYIQLSYEHINYLKNGESKKNNKCVKIINNLIEEYKETDIIKNAINDLLNNEDPEIKFAAAVDAIRLGIYIKKAEKIIKMIAKTNEGTFLGFRAENSLKRWKTEGTLD